MMTAQQIRKFSEDVKLARLAKINIEKMAELQKWKSLLLPKVNAATKEIEDGIKESIRTGSLCTKDQHYSMCLGKSNEDYQLAEVLKHELIQLGYHAIVGVSYHDPKKLGYVLKIYW
jgi:hypothetical protein